MVGIAAPVNSGSALSQPYWTFQCRGRSSAATEGDSNADRRTRREGGHYREDPSLLREQGLLPPTERTPSGYRDYAPETVARIDFVHRGQAAGLTLAQIRQILDIRDGGQAPCEHVRDLLDVRLAEIEQQIAQLSVLRDTIADLRQDAAHPDPETCSTDQVCRYL